MLPQPHCHGGKMHAGIIMSIDWWRHCSVPTLTCQLPLLYVTCVHMPAYAMPVGLTYHAVHCFACFACVRCLTHMDGVLLGYHTCTVLTGSCKPHLVSHASIAWVGWVRHWIFDIGTINGVGHRTPTYGGNRICCGQRQWLELAVAPC